MSNMSYCRFQNTSNDLSACQGALEELFEGTKRLSPEELAAAKQLVETCADIVALVCEGGNLEVDDLLDSPVLIKGTLDAAQELADEAEVPQS